METYIKISNLNDFVYCPKSIFFHELYGKYNETFYHRTPQKIGKLNHESIDNQYYSDKKDILQGLNVYSEKYCLFGKIDIFDKNTETLIERKTLINKIHKGYKYQLYAQYFCMIEMGYNVKKIKIHSLKDNKNYFISIPNKSEIEEFEAFLLKFKSFDIHSYKPENVKKCENCIYSQLCDVCLVSNI